MNPPHIRTALLTLAAGTIIAAAPAQAHRAWILPSTFTLSGDEQYVTVDAAMSNNLFAPNHRPMGLDRISVTAPDGRQVEVENPQTLKFRSVFDLKLDQQGTYRISQGGVFYSASWTENGERKRRRGAGLEQLLAEGVDKKPDADIRQSISRVETFVTLGAPNADNLQPQGAGLELQPVTHPNDVYVGEDATFRFSLNGEPASGVEFVVVKGQDRYRNDEGAQTVISDSEGLVTFKLNAPGQYWLSGSAEGEVVVNGMTIPQRNSYTAIFEALPL